MRGIGGVTDTKGTPLVPTDAWRSAFRGAVVGALVMHYVRNPEQNSALEAEKRRPEERLRGAETPSVDRVAQAYVDYRVRDKTYPVKAQRDSVAVKGKPIPSQAALVEAMFMAELETLILAARSRRDRAAGAGGRDVRRGSLCPAERERGRARAGGHDDGRRRGDHLQRPPRARPADPHSAADAASSPLTRRRVSARTPSGPIWNDSARTWNS
jgi:hypothetical protein